MAGAVGRRRAGLAARLVSDHHRCADNGFAVRVEYDASRLNEDTVANLLRNAGLDLEEKVVLAS